MPSRRAPGSSDPSREGLRILERLPTLIREDERFRVRLWQVLNSEFATKADLGRILQEIKRSREESAERFEAVDRRFEALIAELRANREETRQGMEDLKDWVDAVVGGFQRRAGRSLEDTVAGTLRIALGMRGIDPAKITLRRKIVDVHGRIGPAGRAYEVDIVATDGETWIFEINSMAEREDVERFNDKADLAIAVLGLRRVHKALVTLGKTPEVVGGCQSLGIALG